MGKPVTHKLGDTNMSDDVNPNYRSCKVLRDSQALKAVHDPPDKDVCLKHASSCSIRKAEIPVHSPFDECERQALETLAFLDMSGGHWRST